MTDSRKSQQQQTQVLTSTPPTVTSTAASTPGDKSKKYPYHLSISSGSVTADTTSSTWQEKPKDKPPAPWRSKDEYEQIRASGACTRCAKEGHAAKDCLTYSAAVPPESDKSTETLNVTDRSVKRQKSFDNRGKKGAQSDASAVSEN